jgi:hypothetical protein
MSLPLVVELRRSLRLPAFLVALHLAAAIAVWLAQWPPALLPQAAIPPLLDLLVALSLWQSLRRLAAPAFSALRLGARGEFAARDAAGEWQDFLVDADSSLLPALVVLRLRAPGDDGRRDRAPSLTIPIDGVADAAQFRALRVWLRWRAGASVAPNA